eukprot:221243_1
MYTYTQTLQSIFYITHIIVNIICPIQWISLVLFFKLKFEDTYKHSFFQTRKLLHNIILIIFSIFCVITFGLDAIYKSISHWYPICSSNRFKIATDWSWTVLGFFGFIWCLFVLILFSINLRKFVKLTLNNNQTMSFDINNYLQFFIVKQTNLMVITLVTVLVSNTQIIWW